MILHSSYGRIWKSPNSSGLSTAVDFSCRALIGSAIRSKGRPPGNLEWCKREAKSADSQEQRQIILHNRKFLSRMAQAFRNHYYVSCRAASDTSCTNAFERKVRAVAFPVVDELGAVLFVTLMLLQPVIWLVARSLENTPLFYRCGSYDYPCGVIVQPEPRP